MVKVLIGNIFESGMKTLVNTVNCVGVMGKGIAQEFKNNYPEMYKDYVNRCEKKQVKLGEPYIYKDLFGNSIINFPTKDHWRSPSRIEDIVNGLKYFLGHYKEWNLESVAFPPLGCGSGGLSWYDVGPIIFQSLAPLDIPIEIYAPYGTSSKYISESFLSRNIAFDKQTINHKIQKRISPEWICMLEVIYKLQKSKYAQPIGRTKFQKLCYVLEDSGVPMGFEFLQGSYGPFSRQAQDAIQILANSNLITEKQKGQMTEMVVGLDYENFRKEHQQVLEKYQSQINKTFDLFCRITNTEQSEEVATILFTTRNLALKGNDTISENDVFEEIIRWKKQWKTDEKKERIASSIRNLLLLGWIDISLSNELPFEDLFFYEDSCELNLN